MHHTGILARVSLVWGCVSVAKFLQHVVCDVLRLLVRQHPQHPTRLFELPEPSCWPTHQLIPIPTPALLESDCQQHHFGCIALHLRWKEREGGGENESVDRVDHSTLQHIVAIAFPPWYTNTRWVFQPFDTSSCQSND